MSTTSTNPSSTSTSAVSSPTTATTKPCAGAADAYYAVGTNDVGMCLCPTGKVFDVAKAQCVPMPSGVHHLGFLKPEEYPITYLNYETADTCKSSYTLLPSTDSKNPTKTNLCLRNTCPDNYKLITPASGGLPICEKRTQASVETLNPFGYVLRKPDPNAPVTAPATPPPSAPPVEEKPASSSSKMKPLTIVLIVVLSTIGLMVLIFGGVYLFRRSSKSNVVQPLATMAPPAAPAAITPATPLDASPTPSLEQK